jgi:hypothetical protein
MAYSLACLFSHRTHAGRSASGCSAALPKSGFHTVILAVHCAEPPDQPADSEQTSARKQITDGSRSLLEGYRPP